MVRLTSETLRSDVQIISPLPNSSTLLEANFSKFLREDRHLSEATVETKVKNLRRLKPIDR